MEQLNVFDCSNVLIASFFTDDQGCDLIKTILIVSKGRCNLLLCQIYSRNISKMVYKMLFCGLKGYFVEVEG